MTAGGTHYFTDKFNPSFYLHDPNYKIWTMSPIGIGSNYVTGVGALHPQGRIGAGGTNAITGQTGIILALKPVINLKSSYLKTLVGTGTISDPYREKDMAV